MKKTIKLYLEEESIKRLKQKAEALKFVGRGDLSHYIEKVANEDVVFLDSNIKKLLSALGLKPALN